MDLEEFIAFHGPALEANPPRHNLILGVLERARGKADHNFQLWSLDTPGACALKTPGEAWGIILGEVSEEQARQLARESAGTEFPTVQGPDESASWFAAELEGLGQRFQPERAMTIQALSHAPTRPDAPGSPRRMTLDDADLLLEWTCAFLRDADLRDPVPTPEEVAKTLEGNRHWFWTLDGEPVAMAASGRLIKNCGSIAPVYTRAEYRGRGFAGAVTAHVVDQIFATGRQTACLYVDTANPASNRCYAKLGFEVVCRVQVFRRAGD